MAQFLVVAEDERNYNVFSTDDFDEKGRYIENPQYCIEDFDIIARFRKEEDAWDYVEKLNNGTIVE